MSQTVFAKWIVEGSREEIIDMIEDGEFHIQVFQNENSDDSDTIDPDDEDSKIRFEPIVGGRLDGCYEVVLTGEASGPVLSPSVPEDAVCYDKSGKVINKAYDFGFAKRMASNKKEVK